MATELFFIDPKGIDSAFAMVNRLHTGVDDDIATLRELDRQTLDVVVFDYLSAAIVFFSLPQQGAYLRAVGTAAWDAFGQYRVKSIAAINMLQEAIRLGMPKLLAARHIGEEETPRLMVIPADDAQGREEVAAALIPVSFIHLARSQPVMALASAASLCSRIRDYMQGRFAIDKQFVQPRAEALAAHVLLSAAPRNPLVGENIEYRRLLEQYPEGLNSLSEAAIYLDSPGSGDPLFPNLTDFTNS